MDADFLSVKYKYVCYQRNAFLVICLMLSISLIIMSIFVIRKDERIIITPPILEKAFWVDSQRVSSTYLEQFSIYIAQLMLTKSQYSAESQRQALMGHVDIEVSDFISKKLILEESKLQDENASYVFFPIDVVVDINRYTAKLIGDRTMYLSGTPVNTKREIYELSFSCKGARLLLNGISFKGSEK